SMLPDVPRIGVGTPLRASSAGSGMAVAPGGTTWLWGRPGLLYRSRLQASWRPVPPVTRPGLVTRSASFVSRRVGFVLAFVAVEHYGVLLRTTDGGSTWTPAHFWVLPNSFCRPRRSVAAAPGGRRQRARCSSRAD